MSDKKDLSKSPKDTGGPVVKTGPTRGENRSRNDDGQWRKKRSDSGTEKKKSRCYLTSAACAHMGLPDDCAELQSLRAFRDEVLMATDHGQRLVHRYYEIAPAVANQLKDPAELDEIWSTIQQCIYAISQQKHNEAVCLYSAMTNKLVLKYAARGA